MQAAEGYSDEVRSLVQLSEIRVQIKHLQEREKELSDDLKAHIRKTGEIVQTDTQKASLEPAVTVVWDAEVLSRVLEPALYNACCTTTTVFDPKKLEALVTLGSIGEDEILEARSEKVTDRLMIRGVK